MWETFKYPILYFCIPTNVLLASFGIITSNDVAVILALLSLLLLAYPLALEYYAEKKKENKESKD